MQWNCSRCHDKNFLIECNCNCGGLIFRHNGHGRIHRYIKGHQAKGDLHYDYKGEVSGAYGYRLTFRPNHKFANPNGYVRTHRIVFEEYHQCCLLPYGVVHHIDENKNNNEISNLMGMTTKQHKTFHMIGNNRARKKSDSDESYVLKCN